MKLLTEQSIYSQSTDDCLCYPTSEDTKKQTTTTDCKERRREDVFYFRPKVSKVFFSYSLLSDQLAEPEGTVDAPYPFVLLKVRSGTRRHSGVVVS